MDDTTFENTKAAKALVEMIADNGSYRGKVARFLNNSNAVFHELHYHVDNYKVKLKLLYCYRDKVELELNCLKLPEKIKSYTWNVMLYRIRRWERIFKRGRLMQRKIKK